VAGREARSLEKALNVVSRSGVLLELRDHVSGLHYSLTLVAARSQA
jgi:hypothetical protein